MIDICQTSILRVHLLGLDGQGYLEGPWESMVVCRPDRQESSLQARQTRVSAGQTDKRVVCRPDRQESSVKSCTSTAGPLENMVVCRSDKRVL